MGLIVNHEILAAKSRQHQIPLNFWDPIIKFWHSFVLKEYSITKDIIPAFIAKKHLVIQAIPDKTHLALKMLPVTGIFKFLPGIDGNTRIALLFHPAIQLPGKP